MPQYANNYRRNVNADYVGKKARRGGFHTSVSTGGGLTKSNFGKGSVRHGSIGGANGVGVHFFGVEDVAKNIERIHDKSMMNVRRIAAAEAKSMARQAQRNAKWKDRARTSNRGRSARSSINGFTSDKGFAVSLVVKGGSGVYDVRKKGKRPYYHYLEAAMGKRFATIKPTVNRRAPEVIRKVRMALLKM